MAGKCLVQIKINKIRRGGGQEKGGQAVKGNLENLRNIDGESGVQRKNLVQMVENTIFALFWLETP